LPVLPANTLRISASAVNYKNLLYNHVPLDDTGESSIAGFHLLLSKIFVGRPNDSFAPFEVAADYPSR
jgi:hypothetical protein